MSKQKTELETNFLVFARDNGYNFSAEEVVETQPGVLEVTLDHANAKGHRMFRETLSRGGWNIRQVFVKQCDGLDIITQIYQIDV